MNITSIYKAFSASVAISLSISMIGQTLSSIESCEFDPISHRFLVSNGNSVAIVNSSGTAIGSLPGSASAAYGMEVVNNRLFAINGAAVKVYDLTDGALIGTANISGASFLNGMASDGADRIWVTDFSAKKIHEIDFSDVANPVVTNVVANTSVTPNGICFDATNNRLVFVAWGSNASIRSVSLSDYSMTTLVANTGLGNLDGIDLDAYGNFYVASWSPNRITKYAAEFSSSSTITVTGGLNSPADIAYATEIDTLIIPNSGNQTVRFVGFSPASVMESNAQQDDLKVWPTLTSDWVHLGFELSQTSTVECAIYSSTGLLMETALKATYPSGSHQVLTDVTGWAPGTYFAVLSVSGESRTAAFIVK
ncbi:MAG: SMP-30/gluconolactonase/LRE family protein [Flavobacteriales bacterium]